MAPQQIPALWVYVGRRARYADSAPALKSLADKGAAIGAGEHDGLVIAVALAGWWVVEAAAKGHSVSRKVRANLDRGSGQRRA